MGEIVSKPDYNENIVDEGKASLRFQIYLDDLESSFNNFTLRSFSVADLITIIPPATSPKLPASALKNGMVMVSDEASGIVPAFSDGVNWRRVTDRAIIS